MEKYFCQHCQKNHRADTKIGIAHLGLGPKPNYKINTKARVVFVRDYESEVYGIRTSSTLIIAEYAEGKCYCSFVRYSGEMERIKRLMAMEDPVWINIIEGRPKGDPRQNEKYHSQSQRLTHLKFEISEAPELDWRPSEIFEEDLAWALI